MKIIGLGIDIVEISRIKRNLCIFKEKFAKRILTHIEWLEFLVHKSPEYFLAKRFAAKEAASKAFGTGFQDGITFNQFEIYKNKYGKPSLRFFSKAKEMKNSLQVKKVHISIADERKYVFSVVILEK